MPISDEKEKPGPSRGRDKDRSHKEERVPVRAKRARTDIKGRTKRHRWDALQGDKRSVSIKALGVFVLRFQYDNGSFCNGFVLNKFFEFDQNSPIAYQEIMCHIGGKGTMMTRITFFNYFNNLVERRHDICKLTKILHELLESFFYSYPLTTPPVPHISYCNTRLNAILLEMETRLIEIKTML